MSERRAWPGLAVGAVSEHGGSLGRPVRVAPAVRTTTPVVDRGSAVAAVAVYPARDLGEYRLEGQPQPTPRATVVGKEHCGRPRRLSTK